MAAVLALEVVVEAAVLAALLVVVAAEFAAVVVLLAAAFAAFLAFLFDVFVAVVVVLVLELWLVVLWACSAHGIRAPVNKAARVNGKMRRRRCSFIGILLSFQFGLPTRTSYYTACRVTAERGSYSPPCKRIFNPKVALPNYLLPIVA